MTRVFISGHKGFLGQKLQATFGKAFEIVTWENFDITNSDMIDDMPEVDVLVNCASKTNLDWCEKNPVESRKVNFEAVKNLCKWAENTSTKIIQISSDQVYNPTNTYAFHKSLADKEVINSSNGLTVHLDNLYGFNHKNESKGFPMWVLQKLREGNVFQVYDGYYHHPTLIDDVAEALIAAIQTNLQGKFCVRGPGELTKYDVAIQVAEIFGYDSSLIEMTTDQPWTAQRPYIIEWPESMCFWGHSKFIRNGLYEMKKQMIEGNHPLVQEVKE